jgi:hypothetical protein
MASILSLSWAVLDCDAFFRVVTALRARDGRRSASLSPSGLADDFVSE